MTELVPLVAVERLVRVLGSRVGLRFGLRFGGLLLGLCVIPNEPGFLSFRVAEFLSNQGQVTIQSLFT